jgi:protein TonB
VNIPDPQDKPDPTKSDEPPPGEQLGLDAEGSAGGDDFGLAAHKGGRDLLGQGGSAYAWYAGLVKNEIIDILNQDKRARLCGSAGSVRVWIGADGSIERVNIIQSSGNRECDQAMQALANSRARLAQPPPSDMPPINLHISARG